MCGPIVVTVMVVFTTVAGPLPFVDAALQAASAGRPAQVKLTAVVKLLEVMIPTVVVPDMPGLAIVTFANPETTAKPGWIVKVAG